MSAKGCRSYYTDTSSPSPAHLTSPAHATLLIVCLAGLPGTGHESVPHLQFSVDASVAFHPTSHTCWGDVLLVPPGILLIMCWTKTIQVVDRYPVLPIPAIPSHPADLVATYKQLLRVSPTSSPNQPLLTIFMRHRQQVVTVKMISNALSLVLDASSLDSSLYSLHSLRRCGATSA